MSIQKTLATVGGDLWCSWNMVALWPWPALVWGLHKGDVNWDDYGCFGALLRPGDFILTRSNPFLVSNLAISNTAFKHLIVYVGPALSYRNGGGFLSGVELQTAGTAIQPKGMRQLRPRVIVHAISDGVVAQDMGEALFHADEAVAVRCWKTEAEQQAFVRCAINLLGRDYDFDFTLKHDRQVYCTEVGWRCLEAAGIADRPQCTNVRTSLWGRHEDVPLADSFILWQRAKKVCATISAMDRRFVAKAPDPVALGDALRGVPNGRDGF
ncbi:MAG: hypothetical protein A2W31_05085 [Planctomycetes bacterium RBG_16_64_10]|nr:MAG: hypothetical protein A2W31_05085 [Planctomycetes bacterium RBG_16_64_10]